MSSYPPPPESLSPQEQYTRNHPDVSAFIEKRLKRGWEIARETDSELNLVKRKKFPTGWFILCLVLILAYGIGLLFCILILIDYALKKDQTLRLSYEDIALGNIPKNWRAIIYWGIVVSLFVCLILAYAISTGV